jgi:hypothetical protein
LFRPFIYFIGKRIGSEQLARPKDPCKYILSSVCAAVYLITYHLKWPSELYDIRGVFDGSIIKTGWEGYPTTIYTSTFTGPLGATSDPPEIEGTETQSIAYTKDGGKSWIKLDFGSKGNPVICIYFSTNKFILFIDMFR